MTYRVPSVLLALTLLVMPLISCAGKRPSNLGLTDGELSPCPATPNCVSSDATDELHRIEPFALTADPATAWAVAREAVADLSRTEIVGESEDYLHAECSSALLGFVDDLELHLRADAGIIAVRSASRLGRSDLGVNRQRVESLRAVLVDRGMAQGAD